MTFNEIRQRKIIRLREGAPPRVLDLFAGAGGLSLGFHSAGFEIVAAVELDRHAAKTHSLNFFDDGPEQEIHGQSRDILDIEPEDLLQEYGLYEPELAVDAIIGGPPCQAFARVGRAKLREIAEHPEAFLKDPRANLYLRFIYYVQKLNPLIILMENVPDALNYGGHNIAEETCEVLSQAGMDYVCGYTLLNSAFYGVPQMRERMFILAYAKELDARITFPEPARWLELPKGYHGSRQVVLKVLNGKAGQLSLFDETKNYYVETPPADPQLPGATTAEEALRDLPPLFALEMLEKGEIRRGVSNPLTLSAYPDETAISSYGHLMRKWPGFETDDAFTAHIIRYLPRDYKLFAELEPGAQYPEAHRQAEIMFEEKLASLRRQGSRLPVESEEYQELRAAYVPPYDPGKFPNKWRKMEPDKPARTLMAHLGKDSYSHIHYDSEQARTISVREAARLQSFPDGFVFAGMMNSAFRQVGNAVPPLLAYNIACEIKKQLGQTPLLLPHPKVTEKKLS